MAAWSSTVRQNISDWYDSVADSRLHNDSQQLIVYTRWHHEDLAGELLKKERDEWDVCIFPAIKEGEPTEIDPRKEGEPLWPERHSLDKLIKSRDRNPHVFRSLYQQDPKPKEGLMYSEFKTYKPDDLPIGKILNYTDTADQGGDYLCSVSYVKHNGLYYVIDVYYSKAANEVTEPELTKWLYENKTNQSKIESNAGGRAFARNIQRLSNEMGNNRLIVTWFHQSKNKETRIKVNSSTVNNCIVFPQNWHVKYPQFYDSVTNYMSEGTNKNDDAPDVLTGIVEDGQVIRHAPIAYE